MTTENRNTDEFFYCNDSTTVEGSHPWQRLLELHDDGVISHETAICKAGSEEWMSFGNLLSAGEQVPVEEMGSAEEAPEPSGDPSPAPTAVRRKPSNLTPKRWATVAGAVLVVAVLAYSGLRFLSHGNEKVPAAARLKPAATASPAKQEQVRSPLVEMVLIGNPGNPPDQISETKKVGQVNYKYSISRYEITNAQYVAFLNAVAKDDKNAVFKESITGTKKWDYLSHQGPDGEENRTDFRSKSYILRKGEPSKYSYEALPGFEQHPVFSVTWLDAARFANWMHNGQPEGPQAKNTTEDGAYPLENSNNNADIPRRPEAKFWIPNWNEWYKAAYYNPTLPGTNQYNQFATGSDENIVDAEFQGVVVTNPGPNTIARSRKVAVGTCGNKSAYGVADMAGNVMHEWTDEEVRGRKGLRGLALSGPDSDWNHDPGGCPFAPVALDDTKDYENGKRAYGIRLAGKPEFGVDLTGSSENKKLSGTDTSKPMETASSAKTSEKTGLQQLQILAEQGDASAQYQLGTTDAKKLLEELQQIAAGQSAAFQIEIADTKVPVVRMGQGSVGVIFFGHSGSKEMKDFIIRDSAAFTGLLPDKCSFFLWAYPDCALFDKVQETISAYYQGNRAAKLPLPDIAGNVIDRIRQATGIQKFLIIGNSLGAGIVLGDYATLVENPNLNFLLISPAEAFMPEPASIPSLKRTMLLAATGYEVEGEFVHADPFLKGEEAWNWVASNLDQDAVAKISGEATPSPHGSFSFGHKTIGGDINNELLAKLIKVNLGLANREILVETPTKNAP